MGKPKRMVVRIYEKLPHNTKKHVATRTINMSPRTFLRAIVDIYGYKMIHPKGK